MTEVWKAVPGFEGVYEVSDLGRVRSLDRVLVQGCKWGGTMQRFYKGRVLSPGVDKRGRLFVNLNYLCSTKRRSIASLVAEAFIGPRPEGMDVCHGDGNSSNNKLLNLRYDTPAGNAADKIMHGTHLFGESTPASKLTEEQVLKILSSPLSGVALAEIYDVTPAAICAIRKGKNWAYLHRRKAS